MTQVTNWICYSTGKSFKIGDEVEDANARFFIGAINDSHALCAIDKSKPWTAKNPANPMFKCIQQGNYSATAHRLEHVRENGK